MKSSTTIPRSVTGAPKFTRRRSTPARDRAANRYDLRTFDDEALRFASHAVRTSGDRSVRYTVWSRDRLIGETDLGFVRLINRSRSGWFHPNADGERLMPVIASVLPAMRAYLHRDAVDELGDSIVQPALHGSTLFADLAEAFHHLSSLDLDLRREDGSIVPTSDIGIQDTRQLLELADSDELGGDALDWDTGPDLFESFGCEVESGASETCDGWLTEQEVQDFVDDSCAEWTSDAPEASEHERYQIHLLLLDGNAIP